MRGILARPGQPLSKQRPTGLLEVDDHRFYLGRWDTVALAHLAHDRAALHFGLPDERLYSPTLARRAGAASPEELRREALVAYRKRTMTSAYFGVSWDNGTQRWFARVTHLGAQHDIGTFLDEEEAARAVDALARHLGLPARTLNFPDAPVAPVSLAKLKSRRARERKELATSRYLGVVCIPTNRARPWSFYLKSGDEHTCIGGYKNERLAALARDRAALHYFDMPVLNFPDEAIAAGPADFETLRAAIREVRKKTTSSAYRGVAWFKPRARWCAAITADGKRHLLGYYDEEEAAAVAYDRAALFLIGATAIRNFPDRALTSATPEALRDAVNRRGTQRARKRRQRR